MCSNSLKLINLINFYLAGEIAPTDFEEKYIKTWRKYRDLDDKNLIDNDTQKYFDSVFCSLDAYCSDPTLRDDNDLDDNGLLFEVRQFHDAWKKHNKI